MKRFVWLAAFFVCVVSLPLVNSLEAEDNVDFSDTLTQVSLIDALMNGVYDGDVTYGQLKQFGNFGIGTFNSLDGEMVALESVFYQVTADGAVHVVSDDMATPFACVTFFEPDQTIELAPDLSSDQVQIAIDAVLPSKNMFYAIKIDGTFSYMKTRSVPAQSKPYPMLAEVIPHQPVFEFENIRGTIVGFRSPVYAKGLNVVGYHFHFISEDRTKGGHVLEFFLDKGTCAVDFTSSFYVILPKEASPFYSLDLQRDLTHQLAEVERGK